MSDIEKKLIDKSIEGDVESFEKLIQNYQQYVYNVAYRMMGNEEDAKDMAQEALVKAYLNLSKFKAESKFSTWLYRITINACNDELRKRKHNTVSIDETKDDGKVIQLSDDNSDPLIIYQKQEISDHIHFAIQKLPLQSREVIILKDLNGHSYEEISQILNVPIGTVRSRLNRSRKALKDILINELQYNVKGGIS